MVVYKRMKGRSRKDRNSNTEIRKCRRRKGRESRFVFEGIKQMDRESLSETGILNEGADVYKYRKQLEKIFFRKISRELKQFKSRMMKMEKEEIFQAAYKIDGVICIYETLLEISNRMAEETLEALTAFPGLLSFLYDR